MEKRYLLLFLIFLFGTVLIAEEEVVSAEMLVVSGEDIGDGGAGDEGVVISGELLVVSGEDIDDSSVTEEEIVDGDKSIGESDEEIVVSEEKLIVDNEPFFDERYPFISEFRDRPEVESIRQDYLNPKRTQLLYNILENGMEYRLYVRKAVGDRELPVELEYLPVVESGYKTDAKSKSGAVGMWQFMENSVKPFLKLNSFVDERLDPWKSTDAGLSKLLDNYNYFGDWLLAIAAYNCGVGAMSKAIKNGGSTDFWYLAENGFLSNQTKEYVPKLIAIADLAVNAEEYGIELPSHDKEYEDLINERDGNFDYIEVEESYSISELAREMRIEESTLKKLNPSLTKGFTPPKDKFQIRLPHKMLDIAEKAIADIKPMKFPIEYQVVAGDTLWGLSIKYNTTVQMICDVNRIEETAILKIGKILYIPVE